MISTLEMIPVMKRRIADISEVLDLPPSAAQPLLRRHKWAKDRLFDSYTTDSEREIREAGVFARCTKRLKSAVDDDKKNKCQCTTTSITTINTGTTTTTTSASLASLKASSSSDANNQDELVTCTICFEDYTPQEIFAMPCGHEFCIHCWKLHIKTKLEEGPASILATCPQAGCKEVLTEEDVSKVAPDLLHKFENYQLRNFVDLNGTSRWCPGAGCDRIAAITGLNCNLSDADTMNVTCDKCTTCFCIKCGEEPHQPLRCAVLDQWKEKCRNESETANWILANTKPCPKCRTRIEKNQGCNHMTCQNCRYEFCWICSGDWKDHGANTGGYYSCNKFNDKDDNEEDQSDAALAKKELDRYLHYYKRYHAHAEAQKFAMKQLSETGRKMMLLQECKQDATWSDVEFLKTSNEQLVECRRVLKYTFVFAYYMTAPLTKKSSEAKATKKKKDKGSDEDETMANPISEEEKLRRMQKERFEYHQEMLERFTENLSEMVEKPLKEIDRTEVVNQVSKCRIVSWSYRLSV